MLSVLIPTYNYSAFDLAIEIQKQCENTGITYEIISIDDASTDINSIKSNEGINGIPNCKWIKNELNLGRAGNLNKLIAGAQYEWILLLDCDILPTSDKFIENYKNCFSQEFKIIFGGIAYKNEEPEKEKLLRWVYGKNREEISTIERNKDPFKKALTSNILIHKSVFELVLFNEKITEYGYEDLVFTQELKNKGFQINHINNACYHLNYETSDTFLSKTKLALENLVSLEKKGIIKDNVTNLQLMYLNLKKLYLTLPFSIIYNSIQKLLVVNLKSGKPFLLLFDIFKIGTYINLKNHKE